MEAKGLMAGALVLGVTLAVTGCSVLDQVVGRDDWKDWTPTQTSLQISAGGSVTESIFDTLDQNYYNADELQDLVARSVNSYNAEHGDHAISVPAYSAENGKIALTLVYRTPEDYASYNQVSFADGPMLDVQMSGITFPDTFLKANGSNLTDQGVSSDEALSHKEYSATVTVADHVVQVPGQIRYLSENAELVNSHVAQPKQQGETDAASETGLVLPSNAVYYGTEGETEEAEPAVKTQQLMYIIYEKDAEQST